MPSQHHATVILTLKHIDRVPHIICQEVDVKRLTLCLPALLYGSDIRVFTKAISIKPMPLQHHATRQFLKSSKLVVWQTLIYQEIGVNPVTQKVKSCQQRFTGHTLHMSEDEPTYIYMYFHHMGNANKGSSIPTTCYTFTVSCISKI